MWENPAFMLYAMECEGDTDTRQGKLNKLIKLLKYENISIEQGLREVGIDPNSLTCREIDYVNSRL